MKHERPDYFVEAPSVEDAVLRRIKGNFREKWFLKVFRLETWRLFQNCGEHTIYQRT